MAIGSAVAQAANGRRPAWTRGILAGALAAIPAGVLLGAVGPRGVAVPGVTGTAGTLAGWVAALVLGAAGGAVFGVLAERAGGYADALRARVILGITYGTALWFLLEHAVPLAAAATDSGGLGRPRLDAFPLAVLLVYGVVLALATRLPE
ncbi:hypothetical protein [Halomicrobium urmianum]|uniref:hypothetical protein n=1 Tax=Halomicrobium urmianum TaxID=1586233 RepID=UPI001CD92E24|nr:hypothetical protein [Halomicrobium urmianum]